MLTETQILQRKSGIGGSDVAAILGLSPWKTAVDVYLDKVEQNNNEAGTQDIHTPIFWGNKHEESILEAYEIETGNKISFLDTVFDKNVPFLFANVDAVARDEKVIVEAKSTTAQNEWGEEGTSQIPKHYLCQVAHYASILNADYVDIPVLFFGSTFHIYRYERNLQLEKMIRDRLIQFWEHNVMQHIAPEISNINDAKRIYRASNGNPVTADKEALEAANRLKEIKEQEALLKKEKEANQLKIQKYLGEYDSLLDFEGNKVCTWRDYDANRFDSTRFKHEHPKMYEKYVKTTHARRFNV